MKSGDAVSSLKDRAILAGWIAGLILAGALLWSLSFPFRSACLMRSVNKTLTETGDERRLLTPLSRPVKGQLPTGCWYVLDKPDTLFFVFTVMRDGMFVPCGAEISGDAKVTDIIPLGNHARQVMERIPPGLIHVYTHRIESALAANGRAGGFAVGRGRR
jgi:hypothetical protein